MVIGLERNTGNDEDAMFVDDVINIVNKFGFFTANLGSGEVKIGEIVELPSDVLPQPFHVTSYGTREEWNRQWEFIGKPIGKTESDVFYRLTTD
jgi:hypothetical protein